MNEIQLLAITKEMEYNFREICTNTLSSYKDFPAIMHGMLVMNAAEMYAKTLKEKYFDLIKVLAASNLDFGLNEQEYIRLIDSIKTKVIDEFIARQESLG